MSEIMPIIAEIIISVILFEMSKDAFTEEETFSRNQISLINDRGIRSNTS